MSRLNVSLDETEVKTLLLMIISASEITWTEPTTRAAMIALSSRIQTAVSMQLPHLVRFVEDKGQLGDF